jgi:hypothetical protein
LVKDLKLDPGCNGLPVFLGSSVDDAARNPKFVETNLYLYVDYSPGQPWADWALFYQRNEAGLFGLLSKIVGTPGNETMRPLNRGNVSDIASEACALAELKRRN